MPTTRKKVIKTVYKDDYDSGPENDVGDFSDSGSDAKISEASSSEDEDAGSVVSSGEDFDEKSKKKVTKPKPRKTKFAKDFVNKINRVTSAGNEVDDVTPTLFTVKDLTDEDKLLPSFLNLSESDSSEDESPKPSVKKNIPIIQLETSKHSDDELDTNIEYKDVWSNSMHDDSENVAKKAFMELEQHKTVVEEAKASLLNYSSKLNSKGESEGQSNVKDLLALGEEVSPKPATKKNRKTKKKHDDSDSEMEDWEEVEDQASKSIPKEGLQVIVGIPDAVCRKTKKLDIEMMMKRKINRVKKEHQVYMHKVHVLCWLGHGNYVSRILNDQEILSATLSLVPSKDCYPGKRVDMKYVEQITTWYKDKFTLIQDKNEHKYKPKAPPLKDIMLGQIKSRTVTGKKYMVFIFVSMLRALGLQCRVMFNFVTLPIKPPSSELCSLSTKPKEKKTTNEKKAAQNKKEVKKESKMPSKSKIKMPQLDGIYDYSSTEDISSETDCEMENIMQVDGNDDFLTVKARNTRSRKPKTQDIENQIDEDVSPPKKARKSPCPRNIKSNSKHDDTTSNKQKNTISKESKKEDEMVDKDVLRRKQASNRGQKVSENTVTTDNCAMEVDVKIETDKKCKSPRKTRSTLKNQTESQLLKNKTLKTIPQKKEDNVKPPNNDNTNISPQKKPYTLKPSTTEKNDTVSSQYFESSEGKSTKKKNLSRSRAQTANPSPIIKKEEVLTVPKVKSRTKSSPGSMEKSKYFDSESSLKEGNKKVVQSGRITKVKGIDPEDTKRVSHRDLLKNKKSKNDVTEDLVNIIKNRVREAKVESKKRIVKGKGKKESDSDSDHLPEEPPKRRKSDSDDDFKPTKISPRPSTSRKIDRRVLSTDDETHNPNKTDVWCEIFVEELEQWIAVDVIKGTMLGTKLIYDRATHPVCYIVGWDNNNYLKDLTRRYVPQWNTVTRKIRAEPPWWSTAVQPWLGPKTAMDREEDEQLNRMQLDAPLPKTVGEYKNHPLYALKRHLLKFEAIYPPDAATLGFVRDKEAVYARECVYVCRSRDTWLKEAKVVRLGEQPYKVVKARPKWDKLSNKLITDKPLEVFGPWQVQDYVPPTAENGLVPRNAYGNVELFKDCMLPKGTVHLKLPGLNRVAKKLNIDCAPAMTGFDFNGGWSHPVYDGFVVCTEFEEIITEAWLKDQEEQEKREREKIDARVYGHWKRLIKGLLIRERLKDKYGFDEPGTSKSKKKPKGPRLVTAKRS